MSEFESYDDYIAYAKYADERMKQNSNYEGLLWKPFSSDNVISYSRHLQVQIVATEGKEQQLVLAKKAAERMKTNYRQLYYKQQLFIATQRAFVFDVEEPGQLIGEGIVFDNSTVEGRLVSFHGYVDERPALYMELADAKIKYMNEDGIEFEYSSNNPVSIPVEHIVAYSLR